MARPISLDDIKTKRICDALAKGNTRTCAAQLAGIDPCTLYSWLRRGRNGEAPFDTLLQKALEAEAKAEEAMVSVLKAAAESQMPGTWKAALEWLERRRRKTWKRPPVEQMPRVDEESLEDVPIEELEKVIVEAKRLKEAKR